MSEESMRREERIETLLYKYFVHELTMDEKQELENYCGQIPSLRITMQRLDNKELVKKHLAYWEQADTERSLALMKARLQTPPAPTKGKWKAMRWPVGIAAAAATVFIILRLTSPSDQLSDKRKDSPAVSTLIAASPGTRQPILTLSDGQQIGLDSTAIGKIFNKEGVTITKTNTSHLAYSGMAEFIKRGPEKTNALQYNTLTTPPGKQFIITLPDASEVWLNAASSIRYPIVFAGKERKVEITGEAYFEITSNAAMPFKVKTLSPSEVQRVSKDRGEVEVLGTSFNISAYTDESEIRTTLVSGKVRFIQEGHTEMLAPNEQLIVGENDSWQHRKNINVEATIAWKDGKFNFMGASLPDVLKQVGRWYNKTVEISGTLNAHKFESILPRSEPLPSLLTILSDNNKNFHFTLERDKILISL